MLKLSGFLVLGFLVITGCSADDPAQGSTADCQTVARYAGATYTEVGFSDESTEALGDAELADCWDSGPDARGPVFPDDPDVVAISRFRGFDTTDVLALAYEEGTRPLFRIMVNDRLSENEVDAIEAALENDGVDG